MRELKLWLLIFATIPTKSHPIWVRELKRVEEESLVMAPVSHPIWVRELKLKDRDNGTYADAASRPIWVRELKRYFTFKAAATAGRTPYGCVN